MRAFWLSAAILLASALALGLQTSIVARTGFAFGDFRAFYCAVRVASQGADPYRTEPLHACEFSTGGSQFFKTNHGVTIPAPLPGYAIAAVLPFSILPFGVAAALWAALLLLACSVAILALARFAEVSWQIAFAVFSLSLGVLSLPFGEVVPLALAFICLAAYFARQERWQAAALCGAGTLVEPHLGLPVCIALAVWAPATRRTLLLCAGVLGLVSLALLGPAVNLEYLTTVLPAHALSEISRDTQYSLTAVLFALGASGRAAVRAGMAWYVIMVLLGTLLAGRMTQRTGNKAFLVCTPPAFAIFGGTFIHATQMAAALPAAALLVQHAQPRHRSVAVIALLILTVPWARVISPAFLIAPLIPVAYIAWCWWSENLRATLVAACVAAALAEILVMLAGAPHAVVHVVTPTIDAHLAEASWSVFTQNTSSHTFATWLARVPTCAALSVLLALLTIESGLFAAKERRSIRYRPREVS